MKVICIGAKGSPCGRLIRVLPGKGTSHGLCDECLKKQKKSLAEFLKLRKK